MPRDGTWKIRTLDPSRRGHPKVVEAQSEEAMAPDLHVLLISPLADDEGRFRANLLAIKAAGYAVDPKMTPERIERCLRLLERVRLVHLYEADGAWYGKIHDWHEWQRNEHPTPSMMPPPPLELCRCCAITWENVDRSRRPAARTRENSGELVKPRESSRERMKPQDREGEGLERDLIRGGREEKPLRAKSLRVSPRSPTDLQAELDTILQETAFPSEYRALADFLAAENKTCKVAVSRLLAVLYRPLTALEQTTDRDAFRQGLEAAVQAGVPNATYVKKAAASALRQPAGAIKRQDAGPRDKNWEEV